MGSVHEVIEAFRQAPSNSERGTKFEQLMVRYFELDPLLSQQYEKVWRWIDWPGRKGKPDTGIDLVARERDTGEFTAIQCKFYEPTHTLAKGDIDSFFTASGKTPFSNRVIISTTDRWGKNAEEALEGQSIPVQRIGLAEIAESPIDWDIAWPQGELQVNLTEAKRHEPRLHQQTAIDAVFAGFEAGNDRGKLIMACGTGKTFTALKIAERAALENGGNARILFAVPSISLLSQTLREWTAQTQLDLRAFAVCSDTKVSRSAEDFNIHDVAIPVTTDPVKLAEEMAHRKRAKGLTVVFTTYQSLPAVAKAQELGVDPFDLVICDEAHRTTGVTLFGEDDSNFVRVHDAEFLNATRRLYMTATPRIFDDTVKDKAEEHSAELTSMDDETVYGPEFHRLSFGAAVDRGLLTDYKVIVLTVDESLMAAPLQDQLAGVHSELRLDDASKIIGCWNALAKRAGETPEGTGFAPGEAPMRRAVAFAKDIAASKQVAEVFPAVVDAYRDLLEDSENDGRTVDSTNLGLTCSVHHVDGTFNALQRNEQLSWLKAPIPEGEARILTNARCLSEGVDVPALDAVMFLNPRNSVVDVVQSVGRVMRKSDGKDYGYIILPVAVPAGVSPSEALSNNTRFKVVWQVLNALRAHDDRFNAMVNSIALNATTDKKDGKGNDRLLGGHIGPLVEVGESFDNNGSGSGSGAGNVAEGTGASTDSAQGVADGTNTSDSGGGMATQMALFSLSEWQEAIYAKIVDKVGTRAYWEDWAGDVSDIAAAQITRINALLAGANTAVAEEFERFLTGLRDNLNDSISRDDAISMLSQHLITKPVFDALFAEHDFASHNPVSRVMQSMVDTLDDSGLEAETASLDGFYASVRVRATEVTSAEGKQKVIAELYERFFKIGFKKQSDALGIVYTPVEIVDFILRAADAALRDSFGRGLTDQDVHVLDPFTGTGTFMTRLLQSGLIDPADLTRKYANELHANEITLLAYYVAAVNIETTYHALVDQPGDATYVPFEGIVLADTFQITENGDSLDAVMFPQNNDRIVRQNSIPINVVIGNPPYSVGQTSANDLNANIPYPTLDARIRDTYVRRSQSKVQHTLYDSYLRAFRWATDRIGDAGVVAFVSNGGWMDNNSADGVRLSLADEYSRIYVYNLRGNQRTAGDLSRKEGGKIFGSGSRNTVAILIGVKNPAHIGDCEIFYRDIGNYLSREDKLRIIDDGTLDTVDWQPITPNSHGDWASQRNHEYLTWPVIGTKQPEPGQISVFKTLSGGMASGRDAWVCNYSRSSLTQNVRYLTDNYANELTQFLRYAERSAITSPTKSDVERFLKDHPAAADPTYIKWSISLQSRFASQTQIGYSDDFMFTGLYRPFQRHYVYANPKLNHSLYRLPSLFPTPSHKNIGFYVVGTGSDKPFSAMMTNSIPDLSFWGSGSGQFFPRWTYIKCEPTSGELDFESTSTLDVDEYGYRRIDNITDGILMLYRSAIGDQITKDEIFYYVYGLLHDPAYREKYAADLKKMLPHIPSPMSREGFEKLATAGRQLAELHVVYEAVEPYKLDVQLKKGVDAYDHETWRVSKLKWGRKKDPETGKNVDDRTTIIYNPKVTITGIPEAADRYMLGSRSALAWIIERYQVKTDKPSGIVNDPNDWCDEHDDPTYIVDLIKQVTTVAVETMKIVDSLR